MAEALPVVWGIFQGGTAEYQSRRREFEAWLSQENKLLSGICSSRGKALSTKEVRSQQDTLTVSFC